MKKVTLITFSIFSCLFFNSCKNSVTNNEPKEEVKSGVQNYEQVLGYANDGLSRFNSLDSLVNYKFPNSNSVRSFSQSVSKDLVSLFITNKNLTEETLYDYLSDNPDNLIEFVSYTTSKNFSGYYKMLLTQGYSNTLAKEIYNSSSLTNSEKSYLFLLLAYDKNQSNGLRSFWGCFKRYAKLTSIAVKASIISSIDSQSGVEYATRELKEMKGKYDDCKKGKKN